MNNIMHFKGHKVEIIVHNDTILFNAKDVAKVLGIKNVNDNISKMSSKQNITLTNSDIGNSEFRKLNNRGENFLTESGVYKLILKSRKPAAEEFSDWVTDEVLPSIRQTGAYMTPDTIEKMIANPDFSIKLLEELKTQQEVNAELEKENNMLVIKNQFLETDAEINKPKVTYHDMVLNSDELVSATIIAKDYGKSAMWLNNKLHKLGVIYKRSGQWVLYDKYAEEGYCHSKTNVVGNGITMTHIYWTQKGRLFIYEILKANNILPLIEKEFVENNIEKDEIDS